MKKVLVAFLAVATALAITPAAMADTLAFDFTSPNGSPVAAFGFLTGTNVGGNQWDITGGSIFIGGSGSNPHFGNRKPAWGNGISNDFTGRRFLL